MGYLTESIASPSLIPRPSHRTVFDRLQHTCAASNQKLDSGLIIPVINYSVLQTCKYQRTLLFSLVHTPLTRWHSHCGSYWMKCCTLPLAGNWCVSVGRKTVTVCASSDSGGDRGGEPATHWTVQKETRGVCACVGRKVQWPTFSHFSFLPVLHSLLPHTPLFPSSSMLNSTCTCIYTCSCIYMCWH